MTNDPTGGLGGASQRKFLLVTGTGALAGLAGRGGQSGGGGGSDDGELDVSVLTADGSSTVYPTTSTGASYWNPTLVVGGDDSTAGTFGHP